RSDLSDASGTELSSSLYGRQPGATGPRWQGRHSHQRRYSSMNRRREPDGSHARLPRRVVTPARPRRKVIGPVIALLTAFGLFLGTSAAQGMLQREVRMGVILPAEQADGDALHAAVARVAARGAEMADDEFAFNAEMLGIDFAVVTA